MIEKFNRDRCEILKELVLAASNGELVEISDADTEDLLEYLDAQIYAIEKRAARAKKRGEIKREAGEILTARIKSLLTEDLQTADDIMAQITDLPEVTRAKVLSRLATLEREGFAVKERIFLDKRRRLMGYALPAFSKKKNK